jgi:hypothetical protein
MFGVTDKKMPMARMQRTPKRHDVSVYAETASMLYSNLYNKKLQFSNIALFDKQLRIRYTVRCELPPSKTMPFVLA